VKSHVFPILAPLGILAAYAAATAAAEPTEIMDLPADLVTPAMTEGEPAAGKRVRQVAPEYAGTDVHHALYLPTDWKPVEDNGAGTEAAPPSSSTQRYPVIVEYAGNKVGNRGPHTGTVEDCDLGYGISGGKGFIWVCLPYVNSRENKNQLNWWGDVEATVDYCKKSVPRICSRYGGDPQRVILAGFSRGSIACNFIGLHDDEIAGLWRAFIPHSHYDGVRNWPGTSRDSAIKRLKRLKGRPQFISHERGGMLPKIKRFVLESGVDAPFSFTELATRHHTDAWLLRDCPERQKLRDWLDRVLRENARKR